MKKVTILFLIIFLSSCSARKFDISHLYPEKSKGEFYLTENMRLIKKVEAEYSITPLALERTANKEYVGVKIADIPKGTQVTISSIKRIILFTNDCNEALGKISINNREYEFEFFINCNYEGVKKHEHLPWKSD